MQNLAGVPDCGPIVYRELTDAGITVVPAEGGKTPGEVSSPSIGKLLLGPDQIEFTFFRAWRYWIVEGPVPLDAAELLYTMPIGSKDIRVAGHADGPPPADWATYHDSNGMELRPLEEEITIKSLEGELELKNLLIKIRETTRFVADPKAEAAHAVVDTYHIDTQGGLNLFVSILKSLIT